MRVLVACECSGVVRDAFAMLGHDAWSCDLKVCDDNRNHFCRDVFGLLYDSSIRPWDLMIAHPPCTDLCVSGALHFSAKRADGRQKAAIHFFMAMVNAPVPRICIENPVGIMSTIYRKPDQYVQPYEFGDDASKNTGLWLKGLPPLIKDPMLFVDPRMVCECGVVHTGMKSKLILGRCECGRLIADGRPRWENQCNSGQNKLGPSPTRSAERAKTYYGIAKAMAEQWGGSL